MVAVTSQIDANSEAFAANRASMMTFIERLRSLEARASEASAKRRATFEKRGQLLPADRLHRLLDPGMPFLRLHTLANFAVDNPDREASIPGASVLIGIGFVGGARCMVWVDDSGIAAGFRHNQDRRGASFSARDLQAPEVAFDPLRRERGANLLQYH